MKVGIISDTHDRLPYVEKAIQRLNQEEVELVLHAGDYSAPFVASKFGALKAKLVGVFGNNDAEKEILKSKFEALGCQVQGRFAQVNLEDLKVALLHGEEPALINSLINTSAYDVVVYGHTHKAETKKTGGTLVINPGEVCGYLSNQATMVILDTADMKVEMVTL